MLAGNIIPNGADPIALAYAGHQFGSFVPQLGDGRAILLGEVVDREGRRRDIQLKGSGPTPFSRRGDGRAALGPVLREYIVSEAMAALGIPTTRALAAVATGEAVLRATALPGAVLTRIAASHIRIGTFQFFAARGDTDAVRQLADYVIRRHFPEFDRAPHRYRALLEAVAGRQAQLVAQWLLVGFIHGVMNTDNTSIAGETIDYGPCAFMDVYHPGAVFSSIDEMGRYAYGNQAAIAQDLLQRMAANGADFTLTFHALCGAAEDPSQVAAVRAQFSDPVAFDEWAMGWRLRLAGEKTGKAERECVMRRANPVVIARNHLVEEALNAATAAQDFGPFDALVAVLSDPYTDRPGLERYKSGPRPDEVVQQTFCGT